MFFLNEKPTVGNVHLPGVAVRAHRRERGCEVEVGIIKDDDRCVTANFHGGPFHMYTGGRGQALYRRLTSTLRRVARPAFTTQRELASSA